MDKVKVESEKSNVYRAAQTEYCVREGNNCRRVLLQINTERQVPGVLSEFFLHAQSGLGRVGVGQGRAGGSDEGGSE